MDWRKGASLYQIYPRSFADSDGDGIGDLPGITARLEHVAALGVDGVWLSPFFPSPMADFGYDVSDYCGVDPVFGTLADFDRLVERAHALGLKVVIDQVWAHTSDRHPWFLAGRESRTGEFSDWHVWADAKPDGTPPSNWQSVFGGPAWTWDARRGQYYLHNFLARQPQLNLRHPAVEAALVDVVRFWLDRGVDGFRLDAVNFAMHDPALTDNPAKPAGLGARSRPFDFQDKRHNQSHPDLLPFLERMRAVTEARGAYVVAETPGEREDEEMHALTAPGRLDTAYGFRFLYADRLTPDLVRAAMAAWPGEQGEGWPSWAFSNHDAPRAVSRWAEGRPHAAMARLNLLLLTCLRGGIFVWQGEELGLPQAHVPFERLADPEAIANWPHTLGRDGARTPMPWRAAAPFAGFSTVEPWLPLDPAHVALAVDAQEADPASTLHAARRILRLRRAHPALRTGSLTMLETADSLLAFVREGQGERLICAFNMGRQPARFDWPDGARLAASVNPDTETAGAEAPAVLPPLGGAVVVA